MTVRHEFEYYLISDNKKLNKINYFSPCRRRI